MKKRFVFLLFIKPFVWCLIRIKVEQEIIKIILSNSVDQNKDIQQDGVWGRISGAAGTFWKVSVLGGAVAGAVCTHTSLVQLW